jgi:hypothetical protein
MVRRVINAQRTLVENPDYIGYFENAEKGPHPTSPSARNRTQPSLTGDIDHIGHFENVETGPYLTSPNERNRARPSLFDEAD